MDNQITGSGQGTGEIHTTIGLTPEPAKGQGMSGKYGVDEGGSQGGMSGKADEMQQKAADKASQVKDQAQNKLHEAQDRAGELADQARDKAGQVMDQAQSKLEETGAMDRIQGNPLLAVGIAFGVGFLLAGSGDDERSSSRSGGRKSGSLGKAKHQLKGAVMGGISAAISQQLRTFVEEQGGVGGIMENLTGGAGAGTARAGSGGTSGTNTAGRSTSGFGGTGATTTPGMSGI